MPRKPMWLYRDGHLVAISLATGRVRWTVDQPTQLPPTAGDRSVFVASGELIHALDTGSGVTRWRMNLDNPISAPLFWDTGWLIAALENGDLLALRGSDGLEIWRSQLASRVRGPAVDCRRAGLRSAGRRSGCCSGSELRRTSVGAEARRQPRAYSGPRRSIRGVDRQLLLLPVPEGRLREMALAHRRRHHRPRGRR